MSKDPGGFRVALLAGWVALGVAGVAYALARSVPGWAAGPVLAAFLVEYPFYLIPAFLDWRNRVAGLRLPAVVMAGLVLPYLACCFGGVPFAWSSLGRLVALALALALWYAVLPPVPASDLGFLGFVAWVLVGGYLDPIYPKPFPGVDTVILGHLGLIQGAVLCLMLQRRVAETGYGFIPTRAEWRIGGLHFLYFIPVGLPVALGLKAIRWHGVAPIWVILGTFLGILWVTALSEEFFFRGVLQQWIEDWTSRPGLALALAALLFGSVHLWFRGFPNWQFALVAAINGWFCGRARNRAGSIRAGMVTHALVAVTWKAFFR